MFTDYKTLVLSESCDIKDGWTSETVDCKGYSQFSIGIGYTSSGSDVSHFNQIQVSNDGKNWYNAYQAVQINATILYGRYSLFKNDSKVVHPCIWKYIRMVLNSGDGFEVPPSQNSIKVERCEIHLIR